MLIEPGTRVRKDGRQGVVQGIEGTRGKLFYYVVYWSDGQGDRTTFEKPESLKRG